jgi:hypothetical protein
LFYSEKGEGAIWTELPDEDVFRGNFFGETEQVAVDLFERVLSNETNNFILFELINKVIIGIAHFLGKNAQHVSRLFVFNIKMNCN